MIVQDKLMEEFITLAAKMNFRTLLQASATLTEHANNCFQHAEAMRIAEEKGQQTGRH